MKKVFFAAGIFLSASVSVSAQLAVSSIQNNQTELVVNDSISLKKGGEIQVYLPAGKDFMFVKQKKSGLNAKLLGKVADIAGTGAAAIGIGSGNLKTLSTATKVMGKASAVKYGADAIDQIQSLNISKDAKKIAGKKMEIMNWEMTDDGYVIMALLDKKKYEINLQEAVMAGEVKL